MQATVQELSSGVPLESRRARVVLALDGQAVESTWRRAAEALGASCASVRILDESVGISDPVGAAVVVASVDLARSIHEAARVAELATFHTVVALCAEPTHMPLWRAVAWDATAPSEEHPQLVLELALQQAADRAARRGMLADFELRRQSLTAEESQVFESVCDGRLNKQIASELGVSVRTIEQRRRRVFQKMAVDSAVPLAALTATVRTIAEQARRCRRDVGAAGRSVPPPSFPHGLMRVTPTIGAAPALGR